MESPWIFKDSYCNRKQFQCYKIPKSKKIFFCFSVGACTSCCRVRLQECLIGPVFLGRRTTASRDVVYKWAGSLHETRPFLFSHQFFSEMQSKPRLNGLTPQLKPSTGQIWTLQYWPALYQRPSPCSLFVRPSHIKRCGSLPRGITKKWSFLP